MNNSILKTEVIDAYDVTTYPEYKSWRLNGNLHRINGPAVEYFDGRKFWYKNGLLHRLDGPAVEYPDGRKYWLLNGSTVCVYTQKQFEDSYQYRKYKLKAFW